MTAGVDLDHLAEVVSVRSPDDFYARKTRGNGEVLAQVPRVHDLPGAAISTWHRISFVPTWEKSLCSFYRWGMDRVSLHCPGWSVGAQSQLTATLKNTWLKWSSCLSLSFRGLIARSLQSRTCSALLGVVPALKAILGEGKGAMVAGVSFSMDDKQGQRHSRASPQGQTGALARGQLTFF